MRSPPSSHAATKAPLTATTRPGERGRGQPPAARTPPAAAGRSRSRRRSRTRPASAPPRSCRCSRRGPRRGTRAGRRSRPSAAGGRRRPHPRLRPDTAAVTSRLRDVASWSIDVGDEPMRTSATSPRVTWPPSGRSSSRFRTSLTLRRTSGAPQTCTSKIFCSSNSTPTWMPDTSVVAARRTSPGLIPSRLGLGQVDLDLDASARSRCAGRGRRGAPSMPGEQLADLGRLPLQRRQVLRRRAGPRTVSASDASTSLMRFCEYVST